MLLLKLHEVFSLNETSAVFVLANIIDTVPYISHVLEVVYEYLYPWHTSRQTHIKQPFLV